MLAEAKRASKRELKTYQVCEELMNNERLLTLEFLNPLVKFLRALAYVESEKLFGAKKHQEGRRVSQGQKDTANRPSKVLA